MSLLKERGPNRTAGGTASRGARRRLPGKSSLSAAVPGRSVQRKSTGHVPAASSATPAAAPPPLDDPLADAALRGTPISADAPAVQADAQTSSRVGSDGVKAAAQRGTAGSGTALPYLDAIQQSFGSHDVTDVQAHTDSAAGEACNTMGANAYATGNHVAFAKTAPDLHTAAHEAAHVVQQRGGVQLKSGVGEVGDAYERHADAVADAVVSGKSAQPLLDQMSGGSSVQMSRDVQLDTTYDFSDEEADVIQVDTYELHAGARPYDIIQNYVNAIAEMIDVMGTNHLSGIANFIDTMQFEGSTRADVLGAIFKSIGKSLLDEAIDQIVGLIPVPGLSTVVGWVKGAIEAATSEVERAASANAQAALAAWARNLRSQTATYYGTARMGFRATSEAQLPGIFDGLEGTWSEGDTIVTGDKATMLRNMETHRSGFRSGIPAPTAFQDAITTRWVTDGSAGGSGTSSDHGQDLRNGKIRVWVDSDEDDGQWTFEVDKASVYVSSQEAQAADLVRESLSSGRETLWTVGIPVSIMFHGPNNMPGGWTWYECPVSGRQQASGRGPWWPEADQGWRALLAHSATWGQMEQKARTDLEGE